MNSCRLCRSERLAVDANIAGHGGVTLDFPKADLRSYRQCSGRVVATVKSCNEVIQARGKHAIDATTLNLHLNGGTSDDVVAIANLKNVLILVCTGSDPTTLPPVFRDLTVLEKPWQSEDGDQALTQPFAATG